MLSIERCLIKKRRRVQRASFRRRADATNRLAHAKSDNGAPPAFTPRFDERLLVQRLLDAVDLVVHTIPGESCIHFGGGRIAMALSWKCSRCLVSRFVASQSTAVIAPPAPFVVR